MDYTKELEKLQLEKAELEKQKAILESEARALSSELDIKPRAELVATRLSELGEERRVKQQELDKLIEEYNAL